MGQPQKLAVSAINIRIVQKAKRDYPGLFRTLYRMKRTVRVRGNDHLILTSFGKGDSERLPFEGAIGKFTDIPDDAEWLDTENLKKADEDAKHGINIPENLKPNYEAFYCGLIEKEHLFVFETYSDGEYLSARHVLKWLKKLVKNNFVIKKFGPVEVDIIPDYQVIEKILESETLSEINIKINRVNPDDYTAEQFRATEERLERLRAASEKITYKSDRGDFLELDEHTEALARVGAENGVVDGRLREDGLVKSVSTAEHPLEEQEVFDPDITPPLMMFRSLVAKVVAHVRRNRRQ